MPNRVIQHVIKRERLGIEDLVSLIMLIVVLAAIGVGSFGMYSNFKKAQNTHDALCIFKYDLITRRDASLKLIQENPNSDSIFGIPKTVIQQGIDNQTRTIASLRVLQCEQDKPN